MSDCSNITVQVQSIVFTILGPEITVGVYRPSEHWPWTVVRLTDTEDVNGILLEAATLAFTMDVGLLEAVNKAVFNWNENLGDPLYQMAY